MAGLDDCRLPLAAGGDSSSLWESARSDARRLRPGSLPVPAAGPAKPAEAAGGRTQWLVASVSAAGLLTEHVLLHPLTAVRWQCQVHGAGRRYHLTPLTLAPVLWRMQRRQGVAALWKGLGSCVLVKGVRLAAEDLVSKVTGWPREFTGAGGWKRLGRHLALRAAAAALASPFYAAALAETVQSAVASERTGPLDVLAEGCSRALAGLGPVPTGRLVPGWALAGPAALLSVLHYVIAATGAQLVLTVWRWAGRQAQRRRGALSRPPPGQLEMCWRRLWAAAAGRYTAELLLYPLETALHRLQLQGARAIVDDLDCGSAVAAVSGRYAGVADCLSAVAAEEGVSGLYRGVGALVAQAALHAAALYAARQVVTQAAILIGDAEPPERRCEPSITPTTSMDTSAAATAADDAAGWRQVRTPQTPPQTPAAADRPDAAAWRAAAEWTPSLEQRLAQYEREFERWCTPDQPSRFRL